MATLPKQSPASHKAITAGNLTQMLAEQGVAVTPVEDTHVTKAVKQFTTAFDAFAKGAMAVNDASGALEKARDGEAGIRERLLVNLASVSVKLELTKQHIEDACKQALTQWSEGRNSTIGTLNTFASECKRAMMPNVREHVSEAFKTAKQAWKEEGDMLREAQASRDMQRANGEKPDPMPDAPLRKTFARQYHMVAGSKGMLKAYQEELPEANAPEMLAETRRSDEREDPRIAARKLARFTEALTGMYHEFPCRELETVLKYVKTIDANKLEDAKKAAIKAARKAKTTTVVKKTSSQENDESEDEDVEDALDELLDE